MQGLEIFELEHYKDARGWNTHPVPYDLIDAGFLKNVHIVSMEPGAKRGNHYHAVQTEYIFIMGGPCVMAAKNPISNEEYSVTIQPDELKLFKVSPGIAHCFKSVAGKTLYALCFSDKRFVSDDPDMSPFTVIE